MHTMRENSLVSRFLSFGEKCIEILATIPEIAYLHPDTAKGRYSYVDTANPSALVIYKS